MKETDKKNNNETKYSDDTKAQETLDKAVHTVEDAYTKVADTVGEAYDKVAPAAQQAYEKTTEAVNESYRHTREYSAENPGKTILIALGIGVGIGFLWGQSAQHQSRGGRYARPIVNAVSDIALELFR